MESLAADVARSLGIPNRSMRRAIALGTVHGKRISTRKFLIPLGEEVYLHENWSLLQELKRVLRTEPSVRLAILFGSTARGTSQPESDIDLLVDTRDGSRVALARISVRLTERMTRRVQLIPLADARNSPDFLESILDDGRVLIDRDGRWPTEAETRLRNPRDVELLSTAVRLANGD